MIGRGASLRFERTANPTGGSGRRLTCFLRSALGDVADRTTIRKVPGLWVREVTTMLNSSARTFADTNTDAGVSGRSVRRPAVDEAAINAVIADLHLKVVSIKDGTLYLNFTVPEADISEDDMEALPHRLVEALKRLPLYGIHTISFG